MFGELVIMTICIGLTLERKLRQSWEEAGGPGEAAQSGRLSAGPPSAAREMTRPINSLVRCRRGVVALEFVLVAPVLLLLLFGILYLGIALNNSLVLTAAAAQGAQTLSFGRGTSSPYSTAATAINSAAANLNTSQITRTVTIGGSSCNSDSGCNTLLTAGAVASVALTYPCNLRSPFSKERNNVSMDQLNRSKNEDSVARPPRRNRTAVCSYGDRTNWRGGVCD
jgi:Flp pilus assembly protein TadG